MSGGQLQWSLVSQTAGFGNLIDGHHPVWIADFTGAGHAQVMFYYNGDGHWWLGSMSGGQLQWSLVSQSAGFGNLLDGHHPIWIGDFNGAQHAQVLFYYNGDGNWWLGNMSGGQLQWSLVSQTAGFGNLLDGHHPMWIGDFTGVHHSQVLFYYNGDGNWWLATAGAQFTWTLVGNTGRAYDHRIRVLLKTLIAPNVALNTMIANMRTVYDTADILVEEGPRENLTVTDATGTTQLDFNVSPCNRGQTPTADQTLLFANRNNAGSNDIVVYFVRSTIPPLNGCAAFPSGEPGAVVTQGASPWTLAHECGHVLGLNHLTTEAGAGGVPCSTPDFTRLMTGCGTANITGTPTVSSGEISTMQGSSLTRGC